MHTVISRERSGIGLRPVSDSGAPARETRVVDAADLAREVAAAEASQVRWTWDDTNNWYPALLADGVRTDRAHDLRLAHAVLRASVLSARTALAEAGPTAWDRLAPVPPPGGPTAAAMTRPDRHPGSEPLFELGEIAAPARSGRAAGSRRHPGPSSTGEPDERHDSDGPRSHDARLDPGSRSGGKLGDGLDPAAELAAQLLAIKDSTDPGRLRLLLAAESAGALAAAEMHHAGLPWRGDIHDEILTEALGPRPRPGARPAKLEALANRIREAIDAPPTLNPDSHPDLLRAMEYAGVGARSLRKWELEKLDHPVIAPLLEYKGLYRLYTANGWNWLDTWAPDGRFRMEYVVGGVVTGRWASTGGGALQLPHNVRRAVTADPGWTFVVADAAQLEPRVLAALARDERMAAAGRSKDGANTDMYAGIVATGAVDSREHAKVGMLGAMYGGTTGVSAQVLPRLARAFPQAIDLVERAARAGERGEKVTTRLGRSSPLPGDSWSAVQGSAFDEDAGADVQSRARSQTRSWGRFTRNFVVQGTAAEWALCWIASIRRRLWALGEIAADAPSGLAPSPFDSRPHLVFFLHDEVVVHAPAALADVVEQEVRAAADEAGRLLFGDFPVDFPLSVAVTESYADAKG
ncbi:bifunctional 3'-5' exonuclease/DNA polymerase [Promicromonospora iranensis]|uniref:DNA-directed DNA polymerase n=1 Tax=Promicromonospora iranensis TaxID=1105144 RepID=A0ABU2CTZ4_9MICO|nr:bifunctional 3'-5' exonuclease/DNA polymerase [Promicromonospora iranensis]MDR7384805.1 DNA polymerase-1 [Promicromonospora iranensis]